MISVMNVKILKLIVTNKNSSTLKFHPETAVYTYIRNVFKFISYKLIQLENINNFNKTKKQKIFKIFNNLVMK